MLIVAPDLDLRGWVSEDVVDVTPLLTRFFSERELLSCLAPDSAARPPVAGDVSAEPTATAASGNNPLLAVAERDHIARVLQDAKGNKKAAAQLLGVSRRALYRKLDRLGLR